MCDVTAIASTAANVYSSVSVACVYDDHALMQNRVPLCGECSSVVCLFTQKRRCYCCGVNYRFAKIRVLIMLMFADAHWSKFTLQWLLWLSQS